MQQTISPIIRSHPFTGEREQKYRNIRAKSTGTPQISTDNSFLREQFADIPLTDFIPQTDYPKIVSPKQNVERLIKAASGYLALYGKELSFTPSGNFGRDMKDLIHSATQQLPEGQMLNIDYINNEFMFVVYQANPKEYWGTIVHLPVSIAHTMRLKVRKLFIRFIAFIMRQNNLPFIKDTYDYYFLIEDIRERMKDKDEEVETSYIEIMRSYTHKKGKASRILKQIEQCPVSSPEELLTELKNLKHISTNETEQINCMIRGLELISQDKLSNYMYDECYDNYHQDSLENHDNTAWNELICISWGTYVDDALIEPHFDSLNERCGNSEITEPYSHMVLSSEKSEKLPICTYPFKWLEYIGNDFYKHLVINE